MSIRTFFSDLRGEAFKRAEYRRIRNELATLSPRDLIDAGIRADDAERIAYEMVYG